jgi:hypothetical protein
MPKITRSQFGTAIDKEYYHKRQEKWVWVFPRIDKKVTYDQIVDLDVFCRILFPHSELKQAVAKAIIETFATVKKPLFMPELKSRVMARIKCSNQTFSDTYKAMIKSGLLDKRYRQDPATVSTKFSLRLNDLAKYWENYLKAKNLI